MSDPPEKQSQLGSILQSHSEGAPEITVISPLVDTCQKWKMWDVTVRSIFGEEDVKRQLLLKLIGTRKEIMMVFQMSCTMQIMALKWRQWGHCGEAVVWQIFVFCLDFSVQILKVIVAGLDVCWSQSFKSGLISLLNHNTCSSVWHVAYQHNLHFLLRVFTFYSVKVIEQEQKSIS